MLVVDVGHWGMGMSDVASVARTQPLRFYSVSETARMLGVSEMTLYRQIRANAFPAIRIGNRLVVPERCLEEMIDAAYAQKSVVNSADWVCRRSSNGTGAEVRDEMDVDQARLALQPDDEDQA